jgi:hypothetical protein
MVVPEECLSGVYVEPTRQMQECDANFPDRAAFPPWPDGIFEKKVAIAKSIIAGGIYFMDCLLPMIGL